MGFLRRLLRGGAPGGQPRTDEPSDGASPPEAAAAATTSAASADDEAARDHDLLRAEAVRLADELLQRQMRYADRSWTPPAQGGSRRAGDEASADER